jgi:hypothetical protein
VRSNETNVPDPIWVVELDDQPVLVARDVEYDSVVSQYTRSPVNLPETTQGADSDDSHTGNLACSQYGNNGLIRGFCEVFGCGAQHDNGFLNYRIDRAVG